MCLSVTTRVAATYSFPLLLFFTAILFPLLLFALCCLFRFYFHSFLCLFGCFFLFCFLLPLYHLPTPFLHLFRFLLFPSSFTARAIFRVVEEIQGAPEAPQGTPAATW